MPKFSRSNPTRCDTKDIAHVYRKSRVFALTNVLTIRFDDLHRIYCSADTYLSAKLAFDREETRKTRSDVDRYCHGDCSIKNPIWLRYRSHTPKISALILLCFYTVALWTTLANRPMFSCKIRHREFPYSCIIFLFPSD